MIYYEDLLSVPYKRGGRSMDGMDCYGLVIECCRRHGDVLQDIADTSIDGIFLNETVKRVNVAEVKRDEVRGGDILQCVLSGELHAGYMIDGSMCLHITEGGVRLMPVTFFRHPRFFRVGK